MADATWKDFGGYEGLMGKVPACDLCDSCDKFIRDSGNSEYPYRCRGAGSAAKTMCKGKTPNDCDKYKGPKKKKSKGGKQKGFCGKLCSCCRCIGKCLSKFGLNAFDDC